MPSFDIICAYTKITQNNNFVTPYQKKLITQKLYLKTISINIAILCIGILFLELILGKWFQLDSQLIDLGVIKNKKYTIDVEGLYEGGTEIQYSRDKFGLRGNNIKNTPEKIKILTVGGSTTDQRYIDDTLTWQTVLEKEITKNNQQFHVANAGVDGQSTLGHIANFKHWFSKIEHLKPDYIFFYVGINDAFRLQKQKQSEALNELMQGPGKEYIPQRLFPYHKSAFYRIYLLYKGNKEAADLKLRHQKVDFNQVNYTDNPKLTEDYYKVYDTLMQQFNDRLAILDSLAKSMGAKAVFVSQASNHYKYSQQGLQGVDIDFNNNNITFNGVDAYNFLYRTHLQIKSFCADSIMFINCFDGVNFQQDDYYDFVHLNPKGAQKLGVFIAHEFGKKLAKQNLKDSIN